MEAVEAVEVVQAMEAGLDLEEAMEAVEAPMEVSRQARASPAQVCIPKLHGSRKPRRRDGRCGTREVRAVKPRVMIPGMRIPGMPHLLLLHLHGRCGIRVVHLQLDGRCGIRVHLAQPLQARVNSGRSDRFIRLSTLRASK